MLKTNKIKKEKNVNHVGADASVCPNTTKTCPKKFGNHLNQPNAITLVALVITVIILIILAGVSLNLALGQNGIFVKSKEAVDKYKDEAQKEQNEMDNIYQDMLAVTGGGDDPVVGEDWTYYPKTQKTADGATIPGGYYLSNKDNKVNEGLVIKDENDNEWVWVPVPADELSKMYQTGSYTINGQAGTKYSKLYDYTEDSRSDMSGSRLPEGTNYREPGYLSSYDGNSTYFGENGAGFGSSQDMTKAFIDDYDAMIESIEKYGGFYIGRYELGRSNENYVVQKYKTPVNRTNWYTLYKACRQFAGDTTTSTMIWGTQWDRTMQWLQSSNYNVVDSRDWGNYITSSFTWKESEEGPEKTGHEFSRVEYDNEENLYTFYDENGTELYKYTSWGMEFTKDDVTYTWDNSESHNFDGFYSYDGEKFENGYIIPTGGSENTKANNIYDLAGNLFEWTQEAYDEEYRVIRGGCFYRDDSVTTGASYRSYDYPIFIDYGSETGSRPTLYINID